MKKKSYTQYQLNRLEPIINLQTSKEAFLK